MEYIVNKLTETYSTGWSEGDEFGRQKGRDAREEAGVESGFGLR